MVPEKAAGGGSGSAPLVKPGVSLVTLECNGYSWHLLSTYYTAGTVPSAFLAFPRFTSKTFSKVDIIAVSVFLARKLRLREVD